MDSQKGKEVAFVQCFQQFYDGIKDDPFGNQWVAAFEVFFSVLNEALSFLFSSKILSNKDLCEPTFSCLICNVVHNTRHGWTSRAFLWRNKHLS